MEIIYAVPLLLTIVIGTVFAQQPSATSSQNILPPEAENKKVCVIRNVVRPSVVRFKDRLTVTQAIKDAGGVAPDTKNNRVLILRRLENARVMGIQVDLRAIEKRRAEDLALENNDIVQVFPKDKKKSVPVTQSDCAPCGCRFIQGMHGYLVVP